MALGSDFYLRYYVGHKGKFGHEFLEFEFRPDGEQRNGGNCRDLGRRWAREVRGEAAEERGGGRAAVGVPEAVRARPDGGRGRQEFKSRGRGSWFCE